MATSSVFTNNRTQAVRLPAELRFPDDVKRVEVLAIGRTRVIVPVGESWDSWFDGEGVSPDFMAERDQPAQQQREAF